MKNITDVMKKQRKGNVTEERLLVLVHQEINCPHPNSQCRGKHAAEGKERSTTELYAKVNGKIVYKPLMKEPS